MAYTLKQDGTGNYVLDTQDQVKPVTPKITATPGEFEAYESTQDRTQLLGATTLGEQTQKILREAPGEYQLEFDPETGTFKTKGATEEVEVEKQPITTLETATSEAVKPKETPLETASRIAAMTPRPQSQLPDLSSLQNQFQQYKQPTIKDKLIDAAIDTGKDIAIKFATQKVLGKTFAGQLATSGVMYTNPYTAAAAIALNVAGPDKIVDTVSDIGSSVVKAGKSLIKKASNVFGGTVICTELRRQKLMSAEDHKLNWEFTINNFSQTHISGYWKWAVPVANKMKSSKLLTRIWKHIMDNRTKDIKWRLGQHKFNLLGRVYSILIENGSYAIGKLLIKKSNEVLV